MELKEFREEINKVLRPLRNVKWSDEIVHTANSYVYYDDAYQDDSYICLEPNYQIASPKIQPFIVWTPTVSPYTKLNFKHLKEHLPNIKPYLKEWSALQREYKKSEEYRELKRRAEFLDLAQEAGLTHDEHGGYSGRGDHHTIRILDYVWKKKHLKMFFACGKYLGLVSEDRVRVYAKSSGWRPSERTDHFVVGTNENGVPFCHAVPNTIGSLVDALDWIWTSHELEARHGDVAVAKCNLKHVKGESTIIKVIDSHYVMGEVYQKQHQLFVRNAILSHEKGQHPDVVIGNEWKKIVIARRSSRRGSSAD